MRHPDLVHLPRTAASAGGDTAQPDEALVLATVATEPSDQVRTLGEQAYHELRQHIIDGRYPPGTKLRV